MKIKKLKEMKIRNIFKSKKHTEDEKDKKTHIEDQLEKHNLVTVLNEPLNQTVLLMNNKLEVKTDFLLQIMKIKTDRQSGRTVNIFVNYRYTGKVCKQLDEGKIPNEMQDYTSIRQCIMEEFNNFEKYPIAVFWEYLAFKITKYIYRRFGLEAISMQLQIEPSFNIYPIEPGFHSAIVTIGPIAPLADVVPYTPNEGFL